MNDNHESEPLLPPNIEDHDHSEPSYSGHQTEIMNEPVDRCNGVYFVFYLLGLGSLLPWNFFITANAYWDYKFRNVSATITETTTASFINASSSYENISEVTVAPVSPVYSELQTVWGNALSVCAMLPNVVFQFLNTLLQQRIKQNIRVLGTLAMMIFLFVITEVLVKVNTDNWQTAFFVFTLFLVVLINSCSAIFQSSVFGVAACFPQKYCAAVMAGQGIGGMFAAVAMIIALSVSSDPSASAFIFFLTAIAVLALTLVMYLMLVKMEYYNHFANITKVFHKSKTDPDFDDVKLVNEAKELEQRLCINDDGVLVSDQAEEGDKLVSEEIAAERNSLVKKELQTEEVKVHEPSIWYIIKKVKVHAFCITFTFFVTLACFPAVTARIKSMSTGTPWSETYFTAVSCFFLFNATDWIGRSLAGYIHIPSKDNMTALVLCVLARSAFMVLFAFCNAQPRSVAVFFANDWYFILFMTLFGVSNGHLSTLCMQYGPKLVEPEHAAMAGSFLAFTISVGLFAGAGFSFVLTNAIS